MAPSVDVESKSNVKAENQKSLKVIDELLSKLTLSKAQDEINASALDLATFINGDIEQADVPNQ
jgi:elongation factor 3